MLRHLILSMVLFLALQTSASAQVVKQEEGKGMKAAINEGVPKGWYLSGESPTFYEVGLETSNPHSGTSCARLQSSKKTKSHMWATLMQDMGPQEYVGKRLRMNFWVRTEAPEGHAQPWMRVDGPNEATVSFDNMCKRSITGITDWSQHSIVLDVPEQSTNIAFGIMLIGKGKVFYDDVSFEVVGKDVPITDCPCSSKFNGPKPPQNLSFEEGLEKH